MVPITVLMVKSHNCVLNFVTPEVTHNTNVKKIIKNIKNMEYVVKNIIFRTNPFGSVSVLFEHKSAPTDFRGFVVKQYRFTKRLEKIICLGTFTFRYGQIMVRFLLKLCKFSSPDMAVYRTTMCGGGSNFLPYLKIEDLESADGEGTWSEPRKKSCGI